MPDTPETPPAEPAEVLDRLAKMICSFASEHGAQAVVAIGLPDGENGLQARIASHAGPSFRAAIARKLAEEPDAARAVDHQRLQSMLDSIDTGAAGPGGPASEAKPQGEQPPAASARTDPADAGADGKED